jgi:DNA repair protein RadC
VEYKASSGPQHEAETTYDDPAKVAALVRPECERRERMWVLCLDTALSYIHFERIAEGGVDWCHTSPLEVFHVVLKAGSPRFILVHNHPAGTTRPSVGDLNFTQKILEGCKILGVELVDHVIVTKKSHTSLREKNAGLWS